MLISYIQAAMRHAVIEWLPNDQIFCGEIDGFQGVIATGTSTEACRKELEEVLEEWVLLSVARHLPLPEVEGLRPTVRYVDTMVEGE
jgi:predicted RNase H-like HicB family nuclease